MAESKSDLSRAFSEDGALKTHVGGQALLEGIMMRGKFNWSCAVRQPDGSIYLEEHDLASGKNKNSWLRKPFIRGCTALVESLGLGFKALEVSANHAFNKDDYSFGLYLEEAEDALSKGEELDAEHARAWDVQHGQQPSVMVKDQDAAGPQQEQGADTAVVDDAFDWDSFGNPDEMVDALGAQRTLEVVTEPDTSGLDKLNAAETSSEEKGEAQEEGGFGGLEMGISMVLGVVLAIALFMALPIFVTNLVVGEYETNPIVWNVFEGILRVAIFIAYLWLIGRMKDMKRMFGYHGAEHKAIHCFEHGLPMTPENARSFPRLHVRCGTAFLVMVLVIAILVYCIIPVNVLITQLGVPEGPIKFLLVLFTRLLFLPVIAGVSYEITVKWAGSHPDNPLVKVILWPGMQMQYLTTNEPDDRQIECAIAAMQLVLDREEKEEAAKA